MARLAPILLAVWTSVALAGTAQERVHGMSHEVMPFDMSKTRHIFAMSDSGGVQKVVARDAADKDQIALIRRHLRHEADAFSKGDYGDPTQLHGAAMPGLADVRANAANIRVTYADLPNGAELTFSTHELHVVTAIHRWFGAQLSEHGADAEAE